MAENKAFRKFVVTLLIIIVILALIPPVANLFIALPKSEKLEAAGPTDPLFAKAREVMQGKCSHCHATDVGLPFYASLPGAKSAVQEDVDVGLRFLDLTESFDPKTKVANEVALAKLEHAINQKTMPPTKYVLLHWRSKLSSEDEEAILKWVRDVRVKSYAAAGLPRELQQQVIRPIPETHSEKPERVALGNKLFHDKRLSKDDTISCASCHGLDKGATDQEAVATGVGDAKGPINSPTVYNAVFNIKQFWDGRAVDLKDQAAGPVTNPIEMAAKWEDVVKKLNADAALKAAFEKEYSAGFSKDTITDAIAVFERTLLTPNSRFDKLLKGDAAALNAEEKDGYQLFQDTGCATCHCGEAMGGASFELMGRKRDYFADRANVKVKKEDHGRFNVTKKESDHHKFKVPTLRNIALTFPYFHDAGAKDLKEATRIMAKYQYGKELSDAELGKIAAFLKTLTGEYEGKPLTSAAPK